MDATRKGSVRDEIYKIAAEALRNAHAANIQVEIHYDNEQFQLIVRDDGRGIDSAVPPRQGIEGHYGLRSMRERAAIAIYATSPGRPWASRLFARKGSAQSQGEAS
jgi:signal transduction histidine kinase